RQPRAHQHPRTTPTRLPEGLLGTGVQASLLKPPTFSFGLSHVPRGTGGGCEPPPVRTSAALGVLGRRHGAGAAEQETRLALRRRLARDWSCCVRLRHRERVPHLVARVCERDAGWHLNGSSETAGYCCRRGELIADIAHLCVVDGHERCLRLDE